MIAYEKTIDIHYYTDYGSLLNTIQRKVLEEIDGDEKIIRIIATKYDNKNNVLTLDLGILKAEEFRGWRGNNYFLTEGFENLNNYKNPTGEFNTLLLIPTGVGASIGGHAGDGGVVARLLGSVSDNLILHPNVVNASDLNEMPDNALYVEGSLITGLMLGKYGLKKVNSNRVLVIMDEHEDPFFNDAVVNSVEGARVALGLNCYKVIKLKKKPTTEIKYTSSGRATGYVTNLEYLFDAIRKYEGHFDSIALSTGIISSLEIHKEYFKSNEENQINPWGGAEAILTHSVSSLFEVPSAHAPIMSSKEVMELDVGICDPRKAAEAVSTTYFHCVLKGMHRSPKIVDPAFADIKLGDISCLVIPQGCLGIPTISAIEDNIPIIEVVGNTTIMKNDLTKFTKGVNHYQVNNYFEAVGVIQALKKGIAIDTIKRPIKNTPVEEV